MRQRVWVMQQPYRGQNMPAMPHQSLTTKQTPGLQPQCMTCDSDTSNHHRCVSMCARLAPSDISLVARQLPSIHTSETAIAMAIPPSMSKTTYDRLAFVAARLAIPPHHGPGPSITMHHWPTHASSHRLPLFRFAQKHHTLGPATAACSHCHIFFSFVTETHNSITSKDAIDSRAVCLPAQWHQLG
jgi:hypothetical protein